MASQHLLTARDIAAEFGLSASTVNYYTALGLCRVVERRGTVRRYDARTTRQRLQQIRALLDRGYTLALIKEQLDQRRGQST